MICKFVKLREISKDPRPYKQHLPPEGEESFEIKFEIEYHQIGEVSEMINSMWEAQKKN